MPAVHPGDHCIGYVVAAGRHRLYHSGDTTWVDPGVRSIDVAFVPINGKLNNLDGPQGARLARSVEAALAVPCHYGLFAFNTATPDAFVANATGSDSRIAYSKTASGSACSNDGASRARTGDLLAASQTLSQLSYGPWDSEIVARPLAASSSTAGTSPQRSSSR